MKFKNVGEPTKGSTEAGQGLAAWILSALDGRWRRRPGRVRQMELLDQLSIGGRRHLALVQCGGEHFLVGGGVESVDVIVKVGAQSCNAAAEPIAETWR